MDKLPIIGISQGDVSGIGLEMILKTLSDPMVLDICTPVIYGSPKAAAFYRKNLELQNLNLNQITDASDASAKKINIINMSNTSTGFLLLFSISAVICAAISRQPLIFL